jgi:hypothetical protein
MMAFLEFCVKDIWNFIAVFLLLGMIGTGINNVIQAILRHFAILKHGYPPAHCDANGSCYDEDKDDEKVTP